MRIAVCPAKPDTGYKEKGQAYRIASHQPSTAAAFRPSRSSKGADRTGLALGASQRPVMKQVPSPIRGGPSDRRLWPGESGEAECPFRRSPDGSVPGRVYEMLPEGF